MNDIADFMQTGLYIPHDGSLVALQAYVREFLKWLDDPARQLYWAQKKRIETALLLAGHPIGRAYLGKGGNVRGRPRGAADIYIGNLGGKGSHSLSSHKLIFDPELPDWLTPRDLTPDEQRQIA